MKDYEKIVNIGDIGSEMQFARFPDPKSKTRTRFAVVSDPHIAVQAENKWKIFERSVKYLRRAVNEVQTRNVDFTLIPGDLTMDGEPRNIQVYDKLISKLDSPILTVPGNHDVKKDQNKHENLSVKEFSNRFTPEGSGYPTCLSVGGTKIIGLNSAAHHSGKLRDTWGGYVSSRQLTQLKTILSDDPNAIITVHHNIHPLPDTPREEWDNFVMENNDALLELLSEYNIQLVFSGHHHIPAVRSTGSVRELFAPATCSYPHMIFIVDISSKGTSVEAVALTTHSERINSYDQAVSSTEMGKGIVNKVEEKIRSAPYLY